jgi:aldose 1-epimerase
MQERRNAVAGTERWFVIVVLVAALAMAGGCAGLLRSDISIEEERFGTMQDDTPVKIYTLTNAKGCEARITNYGGIVVSLKVPDRKGKLGDVVLGYDKLEDYVKNNPYFGALVGRYGNRIGKGRFKIGSREYKLALNSGENHIHGGVKGFDKVVWKARPVKTRQGPALVLRYLSRDGEEGYPGNLDVKAVYTLTDDNALKLVLTANTDRDTIVNLTHHSYFNLAGAGNGDILDHEVMIAADRFTPVDGSLIPTGELKPVQGTPLDFTSPVRIGARIGRDNEQLKFGQGYDHNWVLNSRAGTLALAARVYEAGSGRIMEVHTTEPGLQFYTGNFLDGSNIGKGGKAYKYRYAFCMEPQHFPDSPNKKNFPEVLLRPGQTYGSTIIYKFSVKK